MPAKDGSKPPKDAAGTHLADLQGELDAVQKQLEAAIALVAMVDFCEKGGKGRYTNIGTLSVDYHAPLGAILRDAVGVIEGARTSADEIEYALYSGGQENAQAANVSRA